MQPLIADGGELTVLRSLASHAWGQWRVEWPESVPEDQRPQLAEDREHGYVAALDREVGRLGRRFVRADVAITAAEYGPDGTMLPHSGASDVEEKLDAAATRTDGDAFFEREITREGLGRLVPHRDFDVGDVVPVSIWGRVMEQPVMAIEAVSEAGAVVDWRVNVGGELLADDAARRRANEEIERAIAQERRERTKDVSQVSAAAESARETADTARGEVADVRGVLGGEAATDTDLVGQLAQINEQLQTLGLESQQSLMLAVVALETELWRQQQQINEQNRAINDEQEAKLNELREALWQADQQRVDVITLTRREMEWQSELVEVWADTLGVQVRAHTNRRVHAIATLSDGTAITHIADTLPTRGGQPGFRVPWPTGAGTDSAVLALTVRPVPGEAKNVTLTIGAQILQSRDWVQVAQITVPEGARSITAALRIEFTDSGRNDTLGVRVRKGATAILQRTQTSTGGISGGGKDTLFTGGAISAQSGDVLIFEAKNASYYSYRRDVGWGMARLDYIV